MVDEGTKGALSAPGLKSADSAAFCRDMLPRTSRTFALAIPLLPHPLDDVAAAAYLLGRVASIIEDEAGIPAEARAGLLGQLGALSAHPRDWREESAAFAERAGRLLASGAVNGAVSGAKADLVAGLPLLLEGLAGRPRPVREAVATGIREMTAGMAETITRRAAEDAPEDLNDLLDYCDAVASPAGRMLTGLLAFYSGSVAAVLPALEPRAAAFGRLLRLTRLISGTPADVRAGRCRLPRAMLADCGITDPEQLTDPVLATRARAVLRRMIAAAHRELSEAVAYVEALPTADPAIRRFCVATLAMSALTLRKFWASRQAFGTEPVRLGNREVRAALLATRASAGRPAALAAMFAGLRQPLPGPLPPARGLASAPELPDDPERAVSQAISAAVAQLSATQAPSGAWHEDMGSMPVFLTLYVIACYVTGAMPDDATASGMERWLRGSQNPDGGWGMDTESPSVVLTTVLAYTSLRLLGVPADDPDLVLARDWYLPLGGALAMTHWGKLFLAILGVFEWEGLYSFVPEVWLLPSKLPVHPSQMWCYPRVVFASVSWLYGKRATVGGGDPLLERLRGELYPMPYEEVPWAGSREMIASTDAYQPRSWLLKVAFGLFALYEKHPPSALRARAMAAALDFLDHDNRSTNYTGHGSIPKVLDTLVWHFAEPGGEKIATHLKKLPDHLWEAPDGVKMQSFNSAEIWETSFAVQALAESGDPAAADTLRAAAGFLERNQKLTEVPDAERYFRHPGRGGWSLSTVDQVVGTDTTAEALEAVLALDDLDLSHNVTPERKLAAVEFILSTQNPDGGWPVYERRRGPAWLEKLNFSDVFGKLMVEYSSVEPTGSCLTALRRYSERYPDGPRSIERAIERGEEYLLRTQRADGSWEGFWGVCFTYGTRFAVKGLKESGDPRAVAAIDRACEFLLAHQRPDGGWGETIDGIRAHRYIHAPSSQATMTAWALLALADAGRGTSPAARRATAFLLRTQEKEGDWRDEYLSGAMQQCAALKYSTYQRVFPLWALARVRGR